MRHGHVPHSAPRDPSSVCFVLTARLPVSLHGRLASTHPPGTPAAAAPRSAPAAGLPLPRCPAWAPPSSCAHWGAPAASQRGTVRYCAMYSQCALHWEQKHACRVASQSQADGRQQECTSLKRTHLLRGRRQGAGRRPFYVPLHDQRAKLVGQDLRVRRRLLLPALLRHLVAHRLEQLVPSAKEGARGGHG